MSRAAEQMCSHKVVGTQLASRVQGVMWQSKASGQLLLLLLLYHRDPLDHLCA